MKANKKTFIGIVVSDKMEKSIVVKVSTRRLHPMYKKYVAWSKKYKAHDEANDANVGDRVRIVECRPVSKEKCWKLIEVVERAR
ncbi:30S ribosomal protein S17 [Candidatus Haliotispira prima]|uniref:Small ribosomal subunit protein uS17 n=1 Tax=Candidatus Haliotispira prima TaxID=3034016 RepID=A0ABY8MG03_9SPIO|nr:30S ribosomal protein S17 [Candidatus Haliotispira prima]